MNLQWCQELDGPFAKFLFYIRTFLSPYSFQKKVLPRAIPVPASSASCSEWEGWLRGTAAPWVLEAFLSGSLCASHWIKQSDIYHHLIDRPSLLLFMVTALGYFYYIWTTNILKNATVNSRAGTIRQNPCHDCFPPKAWNLWFLQFSQSETPRQTSLSPGI